MGEWGSGGRGVHSTLVITAEGKIPEQREKEGRSQLS